MASLEKWPRSARPKSRGGTGGGGGGGGGSSTETESKTRKRSPETIAKQKATREANKAAKEKRLAPTREFFASGVVKRTRTVIGGRSAGPRDRRGVRRTEQIGRATGSRTARIRRGVSGASVVGQSSSSPTRANRSKPARTPKKQRSSAEQRYRRMTSNLRNERRQGRQGLAQQERLARFTGSRGLD